MMHVFLFLFAEGFNVKNHPLHDLIGHRNGFQNHGLHLLRDILDSAKNFSQINHDEERVVEDDDDHHGGDDGETGQNVCGSELHASGERMRLDPTGSPVAVQFRNFLLMVLPLLHAVWLLPRRACVAAMTLYQATISPDHGPLRHLYSYGYCRHDPTCSDYGKEAVTKRGVIIGGALLIKRLLTCHPWKKPDERRIMKIVHR